MKDTTNFIFSHIAAVAKNDVIGRKNKLPWHIPEDLQFFHHITKCKPLIMGRKTFQSIGKPLPDRLNIVVTRDKSFCCRGVVICYSLKQAFDCCKKEKTIKSYGTKVFIAGGGEIFKKTLRLVDYLYITRIYKEYSGDSFYPKIPRGQFKIISRKDSKQDSILFSFLIYKRI